MVAGNLFGSRATLQGVEGAMTYYRLDSLAKEGLADLARLPCTVKVILESLLRNFDDRAVTEEHVRSLASWDAHSTTYDDVPFTPARVVLQDFTGVPAVVDLAAMRSAVARLGGDPRRINPLVPVDLVIDHSVQVDYQGSNQAFGLNVAREYERNTERYALLRWAQKAFDNFRVVPPGTGIVHQVNLEYLANVVQARQIDGEVVALPDTLVGTDSHTTMISGLGVLGWGVGGIEAEAVMLGQPLYLLTPRVLGFRVEGQLPEGCTATDLVLTVTQILRKHGVVGKFVEFTGPGLSQLSLADRATIANMSPEYGATTALFPVDDETLRYLRMTGRPEAQISLVERYCKEQSLFRTDATPDPEFNELLSLDLSTVEPSLAGPRRPQDRVALSAVGSGFRESFPGQFAGGNGSDGGGTGAARAPTAVAVAEDAAPRCIDVDMGNGVKATVASGSVVIAAITSCTNTSNPSVMLAAGLLAKKAVERGLTVKPHVKTSTAPGSRVVTEYFREAGLLPYLEALGFHVVGYGCTTCIGNSGPLAEPIATSLRDTDLVVAAVLSGNRNFEGRIHPQVRASYLASPPLVVAYALAGTVDLDLTSDPLGNDATGEPVYLRDIWPTSREVREALEQSVKPALFREAYGRVQDGTEEWQTLPVPEGDLYHWDPDSTYVQEPPFFVDLPPEPGSIREITGARVLAMMGDSITTDHISPAGSIPVESPAGQFLVDKGVEPREFNSYGARRGNHEVMMRGTFGNVRLRNELTPNREGDWTEYLPTGEELRIFDASRRYIADGTPTIVIAGKEYGSGSSRDWAAKGPLLLGVAAAIAESYERIHRSNLVGMGILPLQFKEGDTRQSLGLTGRETFDIVGLGNDLEPGQDLTVQVRREDGSQTEFTATARVDSVVEVDYLRNGGILQLVLRQLLRPTRKPDLPY